MTASFHQKLIVGIFSLTLGATPLLAAPGSRAPQKAKKAQTQKTERHRNVKKDITRPRPSAKALGLRQVVNVATPAEKSRLAQVSAFGYGRSFKPENAGTALKVGEFRQYLGTLFAGRDSITFYREMRKPVIVEIESMTSWEGMGDGHAKTKNGTSFQADRIQATSNAQALLGIHEQGVPGLASGDVPRSAKTDGK